MSRTYRYHVDLNSNSWDIRVEGNTCLVKAPRLTPSLPVAIHSDQMKLFSKGSFIPSHEQSVVNKVIASLTPFASDQASSKSNIDAVRIGAKVVVANFVKNWLLASDGWSKDKVNSIVVYFENEFSDVNNLAPTLRFE